MLDSGTGCQRNGGGGCLGGGLLGVREGVSGQVGPLEDGVEVVAISQSATVDTLWLRGRDRLLWG